MRIRYFCHYGALTGYGRAARDYLAALDDVDGVELEIAVLGNDLASPEPRYSHLDRLAVPFQNVVGDPDVEIYHSTPRVLAAADQLRQPGQLAPKRVALTTWETSSLPAAAAEALARFDAVIVPSEFCADVVNRAVYESQPYLPHVVPHCFDEDFWTLQQATDIVAARDSFRFYSVGAWGERKNQLGVLRAYLHAFTKADRVQLMMLVEGADFDEIRSVIARSGLAPQEIPELYVPDHGLSEAELVELHGAADCFVSATRGEGWGLGLFEAAIMGRHVIAPLWGGQADFLDDYAWARGVPYQMTPCFGGENRVRVEQHDGQDFQVSKVALPPGVNCRQSWADPDLIALATEMRSVYENREQRKTSDLEFERLSLELKFGYRVVGPMMARKLQEIVNA